jgi:hypothetical protein
VLISQQRPVVFEEQPKFVKPPSGESRGTVTRGRASDLRPTAARLFAGPADVWFALAVIAAGVVAVATEWRWAAYVLIAAFGIRLAAHLAAGFAGYRDAMERPWPEVRRRPLDDDDD